MTNFYFLTFRCHPNDIAFFNLNLVKHFIPFAEKQEKYYWCVEDDATINQHFHLFYSSKSRDATNSIQTLKKKLREETQNKTAELCLAGNSGTINVSEKLSPSYCNKERSGS